MHLDGAHAFAGAGASGATLDLDHCPGRAGLMAACTMCSDEIAEPRHLSPPHTLTCSPACAREREPVAEAPGREGRGEGGDGMKHDKSRSYAEGYAEGYAAGKEASHSEILLRELARKKWASAAPIPTDSKHPARRWLAARHLWRPDLQLPPSVRWLQAEGAALGRRAPGRPLPRPDS